MPDRSLGGAFHRLPTRDVQRATFTFTAFRASLESFTQATSQVIDLARITGLTEADAAAALFYAGVHPARRPDSLMPHEVMALFYSIRHVDAARRSAAVMDPPSYVCARCGSAIDVVMLGGRSVYFCPRDQPRHQRGQANLTPRQLQRGVRANSVQDRLPNLIFCLIGPPSAGKTTLARMMASTVPFIRPVPIAKTRKPRPGEIDGVDAFYIAPDEFTRLVASGEFVIKGEYYGNLFGLPREPLISTLLRGDDAVVVISPEGAQQVSARYSNTCVIGVIPPSLDVLLQRIANRPDYSALERRTRAERVRVGMPPVGDCDFTIVTESLDQTLHQVFEVIYEARCKRGPTTWPTTPHEAVQSQALRGPQPPS